MNMKRNLIAVIVNNSNNINKANNHFSPELIVHKQDHDIYIYISGADPGFVVRGGVSRRGVWGPLLDPQRVEGRALVGGPGEAPRKLWGFEELQTFI